MAHLQVYDDGINDDGANIVIRLAEYEVYARRYQEEQAALRLDIERRRISVLHQQVLQMRYQRAQLAQQQRVERERTRRARDWYRYHRALAEEELANMDPPPPPIARQHRRQNVEMAIIPHGAARANEAPRRRRRQQQQQQDDVVAMDERGFRNLRNA